MATLEWGAKISYNTAAFLIQPVYFSRILSKPDLEAATAEDLMANKLTTLADSLESVFDDAVVNGDDNELFASGYLRGHFDLVVAQLELQGEESPELLWEELRAALKRSKDELNPQDQLHVQNMLDRLVAAA